MRFVREQFLQTGVARGQQLVDIQQLCRLRFAGGIGKANATQLQATPLQHARKRGYREMAGLLEAAGGR